MSGVIGIIVLLVIAYFVYAFGIVPMLISRIIKKRLERGVLITGAFSAHEIAEYLREKLASDKQLQKNPRGSDLV